MFSVAFGERRPGQGSSPASTFAMPAPTPLHHAHAFLRHLDTAQTEAPRTEQFITYLNQVFGTNDENRQLIPEFNRGAEHQLRIPRPERSGRTRRQAVPRRD